MAEYGLNPGTPESSGPHSDNDESGIGGGSVKEQERFLPIANVSRIMKKVLPGNAKISKDAKETVQECVSEFISFITGEASDKCKREKRKTINGDDLLWAMGTLGFEDYIEPLKVYLQRYRETEGDKTNVKQQGEAVNGGVGVGVGVGVGGILVQQQQQQPHGGYQRYNQGYWMATQGSGSTSTGQPR